MTIGNSGMGTGVGGKAGSKAGGKASVDMGDEKLKGDPEEGEAQLPNIPKNAVGFYDADHAAPGDYNVPPSFGPAASSGVPEASKGPQEASKEQAEKDEECGAKPGKEGAGEPGKDKADKADKADDQLKDAAGVSSAVKEQQSPFADHEPMHGDAGRPGVTPGDKAASVKAPK